MIIDMHTHIGRGERLNDTYQIDWFADELIKVMDEAGVDLSCVMGVAYENYEVNNQYIYESMQAYPGRFIGCVRANLHHGQAALDMIRRCFEQYGFRMMKIHPTMGDGFPTRELMELLSEYGWPLLLHTPPNAEVIDAQVQLARAYPKVPVILGHMAAYGASWPGYMKLCAIEAKQIPNLYLDTGFVFMHRWVKMAADICGPEKIVFGTDAPVVHPAVIRSMIEVTGLTKSEQAMLLGENAQRLLRLNEN